MCGAAARATDEPHGAATVDAAKAEAATVALDGRWFVCGGGREAVAVSRDLACIVCNQTVFIDNPHKHSWLDIGLQDLSADLHQVSPFHRARNRYLPEVIARQHTAKQIGDGDANANRANRLQSVQQSASGLHATDSQPFCMPVRSLAVEPSFIAGGKAGEKTQA